MRRLLALVPFFLATAAVGCSQASDAEGDEGQSDSIEALSSSSAQAHVFVAPQVKGGAHHWDTVVVQNEAGFDGVMIFGRTAPDAEPDRMMTVDRRTGAVSYLAAQQEKAGNEDAVASDMKEAAAALQAMTPGHTGIGPTDFVTPENACFIKVASIAVLAVGAIIAAPIAIEFVAAAATDAAATIAEKGIQQFAVQTARTAWASQKFRKLIAFKIVKEGVKAWLLFSDRGKQLTAPVRRQVNQVIHAKCTPPTDEAVTFGGL